MAENTFADRSLFGGAMTASFPLRFQDVSSVRQVPDHQEGFADASVDESLIFELLEFKNEVADQGSASWFLQDLAHDQDAEGTVVLEQSGVFDVPGLTLHGSPSVVTTAVGQMAISKGRQGREAQNIVKVYLANIRLKEVHTDILITAYEPILINPLSESAATVGAGVRVPGVHSGRLQMEEVFRSAVSSFKVHDWSVFGSAV